MGEILKKNPSHEEEGKIQENIYTIKCVRKEENAGNTYTHVIVQVHSCKHM